VPTFLFPAPAPRSSWPPSRELTSSAPAGSGSVAALAKSKNEGDRRTSLGESAGESRPREPLAETSRTNKFETSRTHKFTPDPAVQQGQVSGNVWDDIPVGGGKGVAHGSRTTTGAVRSVARKLVVEDAGAPRRHSLQHRHQLLQPRGRCSLRPVEAHRAAVERECSSCSS
jgi:hypothetical protein